VCSGLVIFRTDCVMLLVFQGYFFFVMYYMNNLLLPAYFLYYMQLDTWHAFRFFFLKPNKLSINTNVGIAVGRRS